MSWAEFVIRSIGFKRQQEHEMKLFRAVAYQVETVKYLFSKFKPPPIEHWWKIGDAAPKSKVTPEAKAIFLKQHEEYLRKIKENG